MTDNENDNADPIMDNIFRLRQLEAGAAVRRKIEQERAEAEAARVLDLEEVERNGVEGEAIGRVFKNLTNTMDQ